MLSILFHVFRKYPRELAGVTRTQRMNTLEADSGLVNKNQPLKEYMNVKNNILYYNNCQSCVVAYEARIRGYRVIAAPYTTKMQKTVAHNIRICWLTRKNETPLFDFESNKELDPETFFREVDLMVKNNQRFVLWYRVKSSSKNQYHVVNLFRENGVLTIIDNQRGIKNLKNGKPKLYTGIELKQYLAGSIDYSITEDNPKLLRIDNKGFNLKYTHDLLEKEVS